MSKEKLLSCSSNSNPLIPGISTSKKRISISNFGSLSSASTGWLHLNTTLIWGSTLFKSIARLSMQWISSSIIATFIRYKVMIQRLSFHDPFETQYHFSAHGLMKVVIKIYYFETDGRLTSFVKKINPVLCNPGPQTFM